MVENNSIESFKVNFKVLDNVTGTGVNRASIIIDEDINKTTGSAGGCNITLTEGKHNIQISSEDYNTITESITVNEDNTSFTFNIIKSG